MNIVKAFFFKIKALFFNFEKRVGETSPPHFRTLVTCLAFQSSRVSFVTRPAQVAWIHSLSFSYIYLALRSKGRSKYKCYASSTVWEMFKPSCFNTIVASLISSSVQASITCGVHCSCPKMKSFIVTGKEQSLVLSPLDKKYKTSGQSPGHSAFLTGFIRWLFHKLIVSLSSFCIIPL